jgi:putative lipoprotein
VKSILAGIATLVILSLPAHAGSEAETEEEIAARDVWHAAKLRGVAFRAIGQEPGWLLEMSTGDKILLVTDYGQTRTEYAYVEPEVFQAQRKSIFRVKPGEFTVTIEGINCTDSMSGENFEVSVTVELNGKRLKGCGRALY